MPMAAARRRIDSAASPSASSRSRATRTASTARVSGTLQALAGAQPVAHRAVEKNMRDPQRQGPGPDECDGAREGGGACDGVEEAAGGGHGGILSVANSVSRE